MKNLLANIYWWLDDHLENIAKAVLWFILGAVAGPVVFCAALGMYENAAKDDEPVNEAYWMKRGYEPLDR